MPEDLLKRAKEAIAIRGTGNAGLRGQQDVADFARDLVAALESDRALLRRFVEAWDYRWRGAGNTKALIDEARARIGEGR